MNSKIDPIKKLLLVCFLIIVIFVSGCIRIDSTPGMEYQSDTFAKSITLGVTEDSISPLLNKLIVLYLRNQGIHVKELNFSDPSRLPIAIEHKIVDAYWQVRPFTSWGTEQKEQLVSRPMLFLRKNIVADAEISSIDELIRYLKEKEIRLKIAVDQKLPLNNIDFKKIKQLYGWELYQEDFVELNHDLLARALKEKWVDMAIGWSSDARLMNEETQMLKDDLGIFPSFHIMPSLHESTRELLEPYFHDVMERLTIEKWLELQYKVDILGEDPSKVAMQFLVEERLIKLNN